MKQDMKMKIALNLFARWIAVIAARKVYDEQTWRSKTKIFSYLILLKRYIIFLLFSKVITGIPKIHNLIFRKTK